MFDCNLIKSKALKIQENQIPYLQTPAPGMPPSMPGMQHPATPTPRPPLARPTLPTTPMAPMTPTAPMAPTIPTVPMPPAAPTFPMMPTTPMTPTTPITPAPILPPTPPQQEFTPSLTPLLPRVLPPTTPSLRVPANPLLPPEIAEILDYESLLYMNGYLRTQIGKYIQADFLVGTANIERINGILRGVGLNYILVEDIQTGEVTSADFYNLKFFKTFTRGVPQPPPSILF